MAQVFKWLVFIAGSMILLGSVALVLLYVLLSRSLPDYDQTLRIPGLSGPVEIVRDNANVPHIFSEHDSDAFFALGYTHAQDRLWQMIMLRRTAQGRLSEVFGLRTVEIDMLMRRLGIYSLAQSSVSAQSEDAQRALRFYAAGVNARLEEINASALGRGAPEMFLFSQAIAPWQPADSLAVIKLMAVQLSGHLEEEVLLARARLALDDPARVEDILPLAPGSGIAALPDYAAFFDADARFAGSTSPDITDDPFSPLKPRAFAGASNAWAAAPKRSATGGTLIANDPHLGFSAPSTWYLARLDLQSGGVIGATIPGVPVVTAGRNDELGWGVTSSYLDDQDLYIERLNPDNMEEYLTPDGWAPFRTESSIIRIKDSPPLTLTLRWTENGPVLPPSLHNLGEITPNGHVVSLAWTGLSALDTSYSAGLALMRARNIEDALASGALYAAPSQNVTLADQTGIALQTVGTMPHRDADHETLGRMPSRGWIEENRWLGQLAYAANPRFVTPEGGLLGNTNNKIVDRPFPFHVSYSWGDTQRVLRWRRLMQAREVHTRDSFIEAQLDTVSFTARSLLPLIGRDLWYTGEAAPEGTPERQRFRALELLSAWNGEMNEHLPEPLIYAAWLRALQTRLVQDELGPLAQEFTRPDPVFLERVYRDIDGAAIWCDVRQSTALESCTDIARLALDDALVWINERYGSALESLRWGDAHQATHDHPVLGEVPVLRYFVNIRQSTSGGDHTLLRGRTSGKGADPFLNVHGAGYRGVYDFSDPDSSLFVISTGQSGHFLSRHYDDLAQLWRRGEYIPMSLDADLARAAAVGVTTFLPAGR
ncbi:MAG: penicillin acylase family protein [Pseudomonadota bacterium]